MDAAKFHSITEKTCKQCKQTKPKDLFYMRTRTAHLADGTSYLAYDIATRCKDCWNKHTKETRKQYRERIKNIRIDPTDLPPVDHWLTMYADILEGCHT